MIARWMVYAVVLGICSVTAALALEPLARTRGWTPRWIWVTSLVASLLVPVAVAMRPTSDNRDGMRVPPRVTAAGTLRMAAPADGRLDLDTMLLVVWFTASLAMLAALGGGLSQLHRIRRRSRRAVVAGEVVVLTDDIGPGVTCFGMPRIIIPAWAAALGAEETALLVRHEREHLRAGDPQLLVAALAAIALMPWNLAVWIAARRLRSALELDCDARVLAGGGEVRAYAQLLLTVAGRRASPRLATMLTFAEPQSPLERRIRAMTERRRLLSVGRQLSLGALALAMIAIGCETRRPEPLAPVSSFILKDGSAKSSAVVSDATADSVRAGLALEVQDNSPWPGLTGSVTDPLLMVYDASGALLLSGRLSDTTAGGRINLNALPVPTDAIERVEVIKQGSLLPPDAKGGIIRVTLKPGEGHAMRTKAPDGATVGDTTSRARTIQRDTSNVERSRATPGVDRQSPLVIVLDSNGRQLLSRRFDRANASSASGGLGDIPVDPDAIESMNVITDPAQLPAGAASGVIRITLKPGKGLTAKR